ncbi:alpha-hydroxy acid oxidase [Archaeoglobus fulgidus]|jgi:isopentenyl diphosphate isomerase/L-lactate dehydrogenase-like FMN-dependent dehydrogenase|nr:alpha-hydroxy acid oxidase [Archaeoglobus fulgidus]AIG97684.1 L-lactate dehydrogenase (FMN-dependent) [Archaeoglobus fulgidus DSM 8774]
MKTIDELVESARQILQERDVNIEVLEGGTERGLTVRRNREILDSIGIKMNLLSDFEPSLETEFLGRKISMPVMPAPLSGLVKSVDANCFKRIIREAWEAGVVPWIGHPIQDDVSEFEKEFVWIIKPLRNTKRVYDDVEKAESSKAMAIGMDIDSAAGIKVGGTILSYGGTKVWSKKELADLASTTKLPFIVKGVLSERDYYSLADISSAIVVSNHGGRVLDSAISPLELLPYLEKVVPTGVDSGFRYGSDVFKALALGADFVLFGRLMVYALAIENGVQTALNMIRDELLRIMKLTGAKSVKEISKEAVVL